MRILGRNPYHDLAPARIPAHANDLTVKGSGETIQRDPLDDGAAPPCPRAALPYLEGSIIPGAPNEKHLPSHVTGLASSKPL